MKKRYKWLLAGIAALLAVLVGIRCTRGDGNGEISEFDRTVTEITDNFARCREPLQTVADTLPEDCAVQGGETSSTQLYAKNERMRERYDGEEIAALDPALYQALCQLRDGEFVFYEIRNDGACVSITAAVDGFTVFSLLHPSSGDALEAALTMYDGDTAVVENEWYLAWYTRGGV